MLACGCRYGLTDIQEYYANTGALKQAATDAQGAPSIPRYLQSVRTQDPVGVAWLAGVDIQPAAAHALPSCQQLQVSLQGQLCTTSMSGHARPHGHGVATSDGSGWSTSG